MRVRSGPVGFVRALAVLVFAARGLLSPAAAAQSKPTAPERVGIVVPDCPLEPFPFAASIAALRVELALEGVSLLEQLREEPPPGAVFLTISARCEDHASKVLIQVVDPRTAGASRETDLSDVPEEHRPRALALVAAELARSVWARPPATGEAPEEPVAAGSEAEGAPPGPRPPPGTSSSAPTRRLAVPRTAPASLSSNASRPVNAPSERPAWWGTATAAGRLFGRRTTPLGGLRIELGWWRLRGSVSGLAGARGEELGSVTLAVFAGALGLDVLRHERRRAVVRAGPRAGLGVTMAGARADGLSRAGKAAEPYGDWAISGAVDALLSPRLFATIEVEGGAARGLEVYADARRLAVVGGPFVGAYLGLGLLPRGSRGRPLEKE